MVFIRKFQDLLFLILPIISQLLPWMKIENNSKKTHLNLGLANQNEIQNDKVKIFLEE